MTGAEIREIRRNQNWTIERLAELLGASVWKLQTIERSTGPIPAQIAGRFDTLVRALAVGAIKSDVDKPRHSFRDFRRSTRFSKVPSFAVGPNCPCQDPRCLLAPVGDGDWDGKHLWKFVGRRCHKTRYVGSSGVVVAQPSRRSPPRSSLDDFHRSTNFSEVPPFPVLPDCPCRNARCRLLPRKDGNWDGQHLWKFKGWGCERISYVNSYGAIVPIPRGLTRDPVLRDPLLQKRCSRCGRMRFLNRQYRSTLKCKVAKLYCLTKAGDAPDQKHDPPEYFRDNDGQISPLSPEDRDKLRGRNRQEFAIPRCDVEGCPGRGKAMERSSELSRDDTSGRSWRLAIYRCRPAKPARPHRVSCVLPHGEVVEEIAKRQYRWKDAQTGQVHETVRKNRVVRKDRVMPAAECPRHGCALIPIRGPWRRGKMKLWAAVCPKGDERWHVRSDRFVLAPARGRRKRGRPRGVSPEMQERIRLAAAFSVCGWSKRKMSARLFPDKSGSAESNTYRIFHDHRSAIDSAKTTLSLTEARAIVERTLLPPSKNS